LKTVLADPATQKLMEHQGADPQADGPAAFTRLLEEELKRFGQAIRIANLKPE